MHQPSVLPHHPHPVMSSQGAAGGGGASEEEEGGRGAASQGGGGEAEVETGAVQTPGGQEEEHRQVGTRTF